jgi:hypothetical protein
VTGGEMEPLAADLAAAAAASSIFFPDTYTAAPTPAFLAVPLPVLTPAAAGKLRREREGERERVDGLAMQHLVT